MADKTSVAVLGTGIMGAAMARNLARAGLDVRVWNRTRAKAEPLAADGARVADTAAAAVDGADILLTMVHDGPAALDAVRDAEPALRPGQLWLQMSTVGPQALPPLVQFATAHGLTFVDAPVLGTKQPAENGALTVLAAGPQDVREAAEEVFGIVGQRTLWAGEDGASGAGSRLKLVANSWVLTIVNGAGEALALAEGLGVDPRDFLDAVAGGPLDVPYLQMKSQLILSGDYPASFTVSAARKDAALIAAAADDAGVRMDLAAAAAERFRRAEAAGHGDKDGAAAYYASFEK
ncbi:NAD(P)-dependent oxidoreductase [Streptomyces purpurogeneiscleroticus]|uniref:NAD(P)-dependent oxidoreductase n=1 Tax=Streptomyces purpurogeneiscleroticus TaxID=68259 RepID=UPI001CBF1370|nr:NAD(P)-dependent oxidoreductase [Streptomyces purpurogeneiscleroticus]MBZ4017971.1 3-hydroxyisobutyrate dehydrogenase [Streptomyces purpurogeneiscleroticus]